MSRVLSYNAKQWEIPAILDGRKTVTRRVIKGNIIIQDTEHKICFIPEKTRKDKGQEIKSIKYFSDESFCKYEAQYQPADILYVQETWGFNPCKRCGNACNTKAPDEYKGMPGCFVYRTNYGSTEDDTFPPSLHKWRPSIHMPKEAARIWLKVTSVRVERLQEITEEQAIKEGMPEEPLIDGGIKLPAVWDFMDVWNSTIKKYDLDRYGWDANPWVFVIEFERCEKPEEE